MTVPTTNAVLTNDHPALLSQWHPIARVGADGGDVDVDLADAQAPATAGAAAAVVHTIVHTVYERLGGLPSEAQKDSGRGVLL